MEVNRRKSAAPFYAAAAVWLVYALTLPLYEPLHYCLAAGASLAAFALASALCRAGAVGEAAGAEKREPVKEQASTGNPELDKMIRDGELAIREMRRLDESITDLGISADIVRLERASAKIFEEVRAHPEKLPQIRRFMDYYLPTTLKLLNAYDRMSGTGVSGENIDRRRSCGPSPRPLKSSWTACMGRRPWTSPRTSRCWRTCWPGRG